MEIHEVKYLPKEKRLAMLTTLALVINADGKKEDEEIKALMIITEGILGLKISDFSAGVYSPKQLHQALDSMSTDELVVTGALLANVSRADGNIDDSEIETTKQILRIGRLSPAIIDMIIEGMKSNQ